MKIQNLLTEENWVPHIPKGPKGKQYCLLTAIQTCYPTSEQYRTVVARIRDYIHESAIGDWNDRHRWKDVEALIKALDL